MIRRAFVVERWNFREKEKLEHEAEAKKKAAVSISSFIRRTLALTADVFYAEDRG